MQFRFNSKHKRAGQSLSGDGINALSIEDNLALEEIPYPLDKQKQDFYLRILHAWLPGACRTSGSEWAPWLADVQTMLREMAAGLLRMVTFASSEAWDHLRRESSPATEPPKPEKSTKLPQKQRDCAALFQAAKLTTKQEECSSLQLEYGLTVTEIAERLEIDRSSVYERLQLANTKIRANVNFERVRKLLARFPES
jgi:predicted DNA-binding protein YlxM (UPF0122 family)